MSGRVDLVVLTGAGISADSGLATFRGAGGLWEGHAIEDVATPAAWRRNPALVWRFYQLRRAQLAQAEPNAAHFALAQLERELLAAGHGFTLVTQNVDNFHQLAGSTALAMHGSLEVLACERCSARARDVERLDPDEFAECRACGNPRLRPDVVWFGEFPRHMDEIEERVIRCTHFAAIGTSGAVYPAAGYLQLAREAGANTIVMALEAPDNLAAVDEFLPGRARDVVPQFAERLLTEIAVRAAQPR